MFPFRTVTAEETLKKLPVLAFFKVFQNIMKNIHVQYKGDIHS